MSLFKKVLSKANQQADMLKQLGVFDLYFKEIDHFEENGVIAVTKSGARILNLAGYSYLGLSQHPEIAGAVADSAQEIGVGTHGSRVVAGTNSLHVALEEFLADLHGKEAAMVFNSGSATNQAAASVLVGKGGIAIIDELGHTSIFDGVKLAKDSKRVRFKHNDPADLDLKIEEAKEEGKNIVVFIEGVYSMDGDVAPVPEIAAVCKKHDVPLYVDEAHSFGVVGKTGKGVVEHFNMSTDDIDIKMGTLGKGIPGCGGYVAASREVIDAIRTNGTAYVFSAALPTYVMAGNLKALEISRQGAEERMERLHKVAADLKGKLNDAGLDTGDSVTCIIPVMVGDEMSCYGYAKACLEKGVWAVPITWPAVPFGEARLRVSMSAAFTDDHVQQTADALISAAKEFGILD